MFRFLVLLLSTQITGIFADCYVSPIEYFGAAIVLRPVLQDFLISSNIYTVEIPNNGQIQVFCESGLMFSQPVSTARSGISSENILSLRCDSTSIYFTLGENLSGNLSDYRFECANFELSFYVSKIKHCSKVGFYYGIEVVGTPIILAEFCQDAGSSKIFFAHYIAGKRSNLLTEQVKLNPSEVKNGELGTKEKISLPRQENLPIVIKSKWEVALDYYKPIVEHLMYEFTNLIPLDTHESVLRHFLGDPKRINTIPMWKPLKYGNWEIYQDCLFKKSSSRNLEIYAGVSHIAEYPKDIVSGFDAHITFEFNGEEKEVPLYIWNYIIPKDEYGNNEQDFVVVAVNSPYHPLYENLLWRDICKEIEWLEPLATTNTNPVFGYITCCDTNTWKDILNGFPKNLE